MDDDDGDGAVKGTTDDAVEESIKITVGSSEEVERNAKGSFLDEDNPEKVLRRRTTWMSIQW